MKLKMTLAIAAMGVLALAGATANAGSGDKATGGGQTMLPANGQGPGSTIAFTAQRVEDTDDDTAAKGQVQWIDRDNTATTAKGKGVRYHGVVTCLEVTTDDNGHGFAVIGGHKKTGTSTIQRFVLRVVDRGEGSTAEGEDLIQFDEEDTHNDPMVAGDDRLACGDEDPEEQPTSNFTLARGNAQVREAE